jgi:hypothetical protein
MRLVANYDDLPLMAGLTQARRCLTCRMSRAYDYHGSHLRAS